MKMIFVLPLLLLPFNSFCQSPSIKSVLLQQLKTTHNKAEWFVPVNTAVEGLNAAQANWKDSSGNHSIAQLLNHLIFWDLGLLEKFNGKTAPAFNGNNDDTFTPTTAAQWEASVKRIDSVLTAWEVAIAQADEKTLSSHYATIADLNTHNAYHTGQIIFIRKQQGNWNPEKGVK